MLLLSSCSYLLNASRGSVVDLAALAEALRSGHIAGAAVDVYPTEPEKNSDGFLTGAAPGLTDWFSCLLRHSWSTVEAVSRKCYEPHILLAVLVHS